MGYEPPMVSSSPYKEDRPEGPNIRRPIPRPEFPKPGPISERPVRERVPPNNPVREPVQPVYVERKFRENSEVSEIPPNIQNIPKKENSGGPRTSPIPDTPGSSYPKPTRSLPPQFTQPKKRGRQRAKDGSSVDDGVKQLFELYWREGRGATFSSFYKGHLSADMRSYYTKEYINGANAKSKADLRAWRKEWVAARSPQTSGLTRLQARA